MYSLYLCVLCLVVCGASSQYSTSSWSACSQECGGGERSSGSLTINCNMIRCDYVPECTHGGNTDLVFVMDESGSIGHSNYWRQKQFAMDIIHGLKRSDANNAFTTKVALIAFSSQARTVFDLDSGHKASDDSTLTAIWQTAYNSGGTYTWHGLNMALEMLQNQGRPDRKQVVIVLTDGGSANMASTLAAADAVKTYGASVYGIGIGNVNVAEVQGMASTPTDDFYFYVSEYSALINIIEEVLDTTQCRTFPPNCTTVNPNTACSVTCGGGTRTVQKTCTYYDIEHQVIRTDNDVTVTEECCSGACDYTPSNDECRNCPMQAGIGYLQDPNNCQCFFVCQWLGGENYKVNPRQCCAPSTFWQPSLMACGFTQEEGCSTDSGEAPSVDICPVEQEPSVEVQSGPCVYQRNPANNHQFMFEGHVIGTCPQDLTWDPSDSVCSCVGSSSCTSDYLLHYDFETTLDDVACQSAVSENHGVELRAGQGIGESTAAYFDGESFLGVPYMNNHFAGRSVTAWSMGLWYRRTGGSGLAGLLSNGDCVEDPSLALFLNEEDELGGSMRAGGVAHTQQFTADGEAYDSYWKHVVMTYDGANMRFYHNYGSTHRSKHTAVTGGIENRQCNLKIGHKNGSPTTGFFTGYIDEIRIYERVLTSAEINEYYDSVMPHAHRRRR